ncbi:hypothetical protein E9228_000904 [Curtobacterium flaccumfaciens]|uniref:Uncharacterized protein n=1 Tax=Curtobacterium salicis TaxID=1779862 RepID=A0ABX0T5R1_9MICO|nr:hypothetical protein [Curtobacterium sp. WW7]NII40268.1 hypothetical protein [Curtobacterium sp. WW7]
MKYSEETHEPSEWPEAMTMVIDDHDLELLELLFVRAAWSLQIPGEAPSAAGNVPVGSSSAPGADRDKLASRWASEWAAAVQEAPVERNVERWHDKYGWSGIDHDAFEAWVFDQRSESRALPALEDSPETAVTSELVGAWERGLRKVTVLPIDGGWTATRGAEELLLGADVRANRDEYSTALGRFGQ